MNRTHLCQCTEPRHQERLQKTQAKGNAIISLLCSLTLPVKVLLQHRCFYSIYNQSLTAEYMYILCNQASVTLRVTQMTLSASLICGCWVPWTSSSQSQIPRLQRATHLKNTHTKNRDIMSNKWMNNCQHIKNKHTNMKWDKMHNPLCWRSGN